MTTQTKVKIALVTICPKCGWAKRGEDAFQCPNCAMKVDGQEPQYLPETILKHFEHHEDNWRDMCSPRD